MISTSSVNKIIGECKQVSKIAHLLHPPALPHKEIPTVSFLLYKDDFIWGNLTAREHLELFAGIRGVSKADMPEMVQKWLESVDLMLVQNQRVRTFSGGMKRRLSVAMSTIGNSNVVVLDEPTTGMDPVSRRCEYLRLCVSASSSALTRIIENHQMFGIT